MVPAECPVHQLSDGFNLTEACAPQHTLDLFRAGDREEEEHLELKTAANNGHLLWTCDAANAANLIKSAH